MNELQNLKEMKAEYVKRKADEIQAAMVKGSCFSFKVSTCDYRGWDREFHRNFLDIASELKDRGFKVSGTVNHGVSDWIISL